MSARPLPEIGLTSRLVLHRLSVHEEDDDLIVGRVRRGNFVSLPEEVRPLLVALQEGATVGEAENKARERTGLEIDGIEFARGLVENGFVQEVDGVSLDPTDPGETEPPRPGISRVLFSAPAVLLLLLWVGLATFETLLHPSIWPTYSSIFWSPYLSLSLGVVVGLASIEASVHEVAHRAAARSLGVPSRIRFGARLTNLILQTETPGLWSVPRRKRVRVYLAGMAWDALVVASVLMLLVSIALPDWVQRLLEGFLLMVLLSFTFQMQVYMRTDLYRVLAEVVRSPNLFTDAVEHLRWVGGRFLFRAHLRRTAPAGADPAAALPLRERKVVLAYAWGAAGVSIAATGAGLVIWGPVLVLLLYRAAVEVGAGLVTHSWVLVADGLGVLLLMTYDHVVWLHVKLRDRRETLREERSTAPPSATDPAETAPATP